jgi:Na+-translocating ferredoxin:NAD+ oxidoreductase RnfA subunit
MINFGLRRLVENKNIPECFKGTPAVFIYVSILALAFSGVSGKGLSL